MTVRVPVRQVSADRRYFNIDMCRDIDYTSGGRSRRGSPKAGTTVVHNGTEY